MFNSIIDIIFAACCGTMYGMADMFGRTYEYVNVVLFCYVEPVLTVLMILGALYALFRLPKAKHVTKSFHVARRNRFGIDWDSADCFCHSCLGHGRYA